MIEEIVSSESKEIKNTDYCGIKEIKPQTDISSQECNNFWDGIFNKDSQGFKDDKYFSSYSDRLKHTPDDAISALGKWEGERGESKFVPSKDTVRGRAALDKLAEKGLDGIEYKNAEPDFSKCSEATVEIDKMSENRYDYYDMDGTRMMGNFSQADIKCADKWSGEGKNGNTNWTPRDVADWRQENRCSWHERCDTKTMDLVPRDIHEQCIHSGGVYECKLRDKTDIGGEFDE